MTKYAHIDVDKGIIKITNSFNLNPRYNFGDYTFINWTLNRSNNVISGDILVFEFDMYGKNDIKDVHPDSLVTKKKSFSKETYQVVYEGWQRMKETKKLVVRRTPPFTVIEIDGDDE